MTTSMIATVDIFEFLLDGQPVGVGTKVEFDYWAGEGVFEGYTIGAVIGREPASEDDRRRAAWARDPVAKAA